MDKYASKGPSYGICASCDKSGPVHDVGAYDNVSRFCQGCVARFGADVLEAASNAALAAKQVKKVRTTCIRCESPLIIGAKTLMCSECTGVYKERFGTIPKWQ